MEKKKPIKYKFGKIEVSRGLIPTPQDWLSMKLMERHGNDLFFGHYNDIQKNEKKLKKKGLKHEEKKALEDQIKIDKHLGHLWWINNVRNKTFENVEYTQWVADLYKELPEELKITEEKKPMEMRDWFMLASSIVGEYGPKLIDVKAELEKLEDEIDKI